MRPSVPLLLLLLLPVALALGAGGALLPDDGGWGALVGIAHGIVVGCPVLVPVGAVTGFDLTRRWRSPPP